MNAHAASSLPKERKVAPEAQAPEAQDPEAPAAQAPAAQAPEAQAPKAPKKYKLKLKKSVQTKK